MDKSPAAFRTISEVAQDLALPQHVLRFWETRFTQIKPLKRGGGRRYYRPEDVELLRSIRHLLYADGYTIKGVQRLLREHGARAVAAAAAGTDLEPVARRAADSAADQSPDEDLAGTGAQVEPESDLPALFTEPVRVRTAPEPVATGLERDKLQAVLADLAECERLLAAARTL